MSKKLILFERQQYSQNNTNQKIQQVSEQFSEEWVGLQVIILKMGRDSANKINIVLM